jgi:hypothetical protein
MAGRLRSDGGMRKTKRKTLYDHGWRTRTIGAVIVAALLAIAASIIWETVGFAIDDGWQKIVPIVSELSIAKVMAVMLGTAIYLYTMAVFVVFTHALRDDLVRLTKWIDLCLRFLAGLPLVLLVSITLSPWEGLQLDEWINKFIFIICLSLASVPTAVVILAESEHDDLDSITAAESLGLSPGYIFWTIRLWQNWRRIVLAIAVAACRTIAEISLLLNVVGKNADTTGDILSVASTLAQSIHVQDNFLLIMLIICLSLIGRGIFTLMAGGGRTA